MNNYFTIKELVYSATAEKLKINNKPTKEIETNLKELIDFLNPLREAWGSPIIVSSGYRCPELNKAIGGVVNSAHQYGFAVDLIPANGKMEAFKKFVVNYLIDNNCFWDQLLREKKASTEWVHLGLYSNDGQQRKQIKDINV